MSQLLLLLEAEKQLLPSTPKTSHLRRSTATSQPPSRLSPARVLTVHLQPQSTSARASVLEYGELHYLWASFVSEQRK